MVRKAIPAIMAGLALFSLMVFTSGKATAANVSPKAEQLGIEATDAMKNWTGDLDGMIERRVIRVLTSYSKTFYFHDKGKQRGATYDIFRLFEEDLNKQLEKDKKLRQKHLKIHVVFIPVARGDLLQALAAGKGDIAAANLTITEERRKLVDFSKPLGGNVSERLISGPDSMAVYGLNDLAGKEVFVRKSSSYYESLTALNMHFAAEKRPAVIIREAPDALEDEDLIEMVNAGLVPFIVVDSHKANFWKEIFPKIKVHQDIALRTGGEIAWAIRKNSPQLKALVDDFVTRHGKGTLLGNIIFKRYLKDTKYVKNATSEAERRKFIALIETFRKYGDQYNVDWLLMAAQGYQESQLNQTVRSKAGAIGVMQIMPATGKELGVGDISKVDPNVHAGTKYMRLMIDQYYANEPMTDLNKALFALASYNAGAGKIAQLRKEAARRGLDPNIWFRNVEYVAADKIGAETVTYVANIFKYYIAYQLIVEAIVKQKQAEQQFKSQIK